MPPVMRRKPTGQAIAPDRPGGRIVRPRPMRARQPAPRPQAPTVNITTAPAAQPAPGPAVKEGFQPSPLVLALIVGAFLLFMGKR